MATTKIRRTSKKADPSLVPDEMRAVLDKIKEKFGDESVVTGAQLKQPGRIRTNIFPLDLALLGGIPHNRITMYHGKKHSGKSTAVNKTIAGAQQSMPHSIPVVIDVEGTFDSVWAQKHGVDLSRVEIVHPDTGEEAVDMAVALIRARETSLVAVDSLAALLPYKEQEASAEDSLVAQQSRLITSFLRKVSSAQIAERKRGHKVTLLVTNQHRVKIGGWSPTGEPRSLPGGNALGHFTSVEVLFKNKENIGKSGDNDGRNTTNEHAFTIEKNKLNGGIRSGDYVMLRQDDDSLGLKEGDIEDAGTMLAMAKKLGWYTGGGRGGYKLEFGDYEAIPFPNGDEAAKYLYEVREVYDDLRIHLFAQEARRQKMPEDFITYLMGA